MWSPKSSEETIDYEFDFRAALMKLGDTIKTATVTASGPNGSTALTIGDIVSTGTSVRAYLGGGTSGIVYDVKCKIVTAALGTRARTLTLISQLTIT